MNQDDICKSIASTWIQDGNSEALKHTQALQQNWPAPEIPEDMHARGAHTDSRPFRFPLWPLGCHTAPIDEAVLLCYCARHVGCWAPGGASRSERRNHLSVSMAVRGRAWSRENDAYEKATVTLALACQNSMKRKVPTSLSFPAAGRRHRCCPCGSRNPVWNVGIPFWTIGVSLFFFHRTCECWTSKCS